MSVIRIALAASIALCICVGAGPIAAQNRPAAERPLGAAANGATAQERLLMEQIDQLAADAQFGEAIASLERLVDNAEGRLIELGPVQRAATLVLQVHAPIARWAQWRLHSWSTRAPERIGEAMRADQDMAVRGTQHAMERLDYAELQRVVDRFSLAPASLAARFFLSDLYLDRGWTVAARQAFDVPGLSLRVPLKPGASSADPAVGGLPWPTTWPHVQRFEQRGALLDQSRAALTPLPDRSVDEVAAEVAVHMLRIAAFDCPASEFTDTCNWATALADRLSPAAQQRLKENVLTAQAWFEERQQQRGEQSRGEWLTFAGNASRSGTALDNTPQNSAGNSVGNSDGDSSSGAGVGDWPAWTVQLERLTGSTDRSSASKPPVAESSLGLVSYHPLVHEGRVYVHQLTRVVAFDLDNGRSWPPIDPPLPVFDSGMTAANYLPFGYALAGVPRGTLTIDRDTLYARMGPPVTGWYGRAPGNSEGQSVHSLSYLIALDLKRQGSMRAGYPVRLGAAQFPGSEFEGCPLVSEDQLIVAVATRDNVNLRRSVVAVDRETGAILWRSPTLASGMVSGSEQASLVAHQLVAVSGGRIFVNTNLGAIACLDQATGQIVWLARYRRSPPSIDQPYPQPDRFRYRDLTPCMVSGTQVICAPQDCPEIFALDITSGDLLWSTDAERVDDATQLLGVSNNNIIVSGDRIFWLERSSGRVIAAFPPGGMADVASALPVPRGFGRGVVGAGQVYWPTQQEVFVFDSDQMGRAVDGAPIIRQRIGLAPRGAEGGNLVLFEDGMIIAGPSRLFVFKDGQRR